MSESSIDIVQDFLRLQYEGKIDEAFNAHAAPEFAWIVGVKNSELTAAIPWAGYEHKGLSGYKNLTELLFGEYEPLIFDARKFHDTGESVLVEGYFQFKHRITEKIAESDWIGRFDIKNGKIAGGQFFENTYAIASARQP